MSASLEEQIGKIKLILVWHRLAKPENVPGELSLENMQKEIEKLKTEMLLNFLDGKEKDEIKFCLVDLATEYWDSDMSDEEMSRRYKQCLTV